MERDELRWWQIPVSLVACGLGVIVWALVLGGLVVGGTALLQIAFDALMR
jgi:hypothetical protein